jgi:hypothetical protein
VAGVLVGADGLGLEVFGERAGGGDFSLHHDLLSQVFRAIRVNHLILFLFLI